MVDTQTGRWNVFASKEQERSISVVGGIACYKEYILVTAQYKTDAGFNVRINSSCINYTPRC